LFVNYRLNFRGMCANSEGRNQTKAGGIVARWPTIANIVIPEAYEGE